MQDYPRWRGEREQSDGGRGATAALSRRQWLRGSASLAGGLLLGGTGPLLGPREARADAAVKTGQFIFPRLQFSVLDNTPDIWNVHPKGDANLRQKLSELTNINVSTQPKVVRLDDFDDMCRHPFVFMTSEGVFKLPDIEERNLREFLERGGFVLADDCVYQGKEDRFFQSYVKLIDRLFPDNPMRKIPLDHEIFNIYYEVKNGCPHMQGVPHGAYGLFERGTGRIMTVATPGDIHCGWAMSGSWGEKGQLASVQMGINIVMYYLSH